MSRRSRKTSNSISSIQLQLTVPYRTWRHIKTKIHITKHNRRKRRMNHGSKVTHVPSTIDLILNRLLNQHISSSGSGSNFGGPISELYALSLRAWSHDTAHGPNASDAAQKFLSIVQHMQHEYESTGDLTVKPESYHFPSALGAFAKACVFYNSPRSRTFAKANATI